MRDIKNDIEKDVAQLGHSLWKTNMITAFRHPTPYYWTRTEVRKNPEGDGLSIWDNYIIYGPWLEGLGSRNSPKTRFPGYASMRRAAGVLERRASGTANNTIRRHVGRLN